MSNLTGNCSWCFKKAPQTLMKKGNMINRSTYQCTNCQEKTVPCHKKCGDFARIVPGFEEKLCYVHRGLIKSWDSEVCIKALHPKKYCSNCFELTTHRITIITPIGKGRTYECTSCNRNTEECKTCTEAFAAEGTGKKCAKCQGTVKDWSDVENNKESLNVIQSCSWCLSKTKHIIRDQQKKQYQCANCGGATQPCDKCKECMKTSSECARCVLTKKEGKGAWDKKLEAKKAYVGKYESWNERMKDAKRASEFRTKAVEAGVIRPFVILVLMHPDVRAYVAMNLEIVLHSQEGFMDPHAEAWTIFSEKNGLIYRSTPPEKKKKKENADWFQILYRLMEMYIPEDDWAEMPTDSLSVSKTPSNDEMQGLELSVLKSILTKQVAALSDVAQQNYNLFKAGTEYKMYNDLLKEFKNYKPEMNVYNDVQLLQAFVQNGFQNKETLLTKEEVEKANILEKYAGTDSSSVGAKDQTLSFAQDIANKVGEGIRGNIVQGAASAILPPLGLALAVADLGKTITDLTMGDSFDVCVVPVREIMLHQALMVARGIDVNELYVAE